MRKFWQREEAAVAGVENTERVPSKATWASVPRWRLGLTLLLALLNAGLSGALLMQHYGDARAAAAVSQLCGEGGQSGCDTVARSPYSSVRGVPVAAFGLVFALSLALLCALALLGGPDTRATAAGIALAGLLLSLVVAVVLLGVQLVLIKAFCKLCLLTYAVNALAFMIVLPTRRNGAALGSSMRYSEGRVAIAGWGLGTVALVAAVLAFNTALASRATAGSGPGPSLLGESAPPSGSPAPAGSEAQRYQEEARVAQEQARRLQEILDDPKKLSDYFGEKARQEYEQGPVLPFNLKGTPFKGPADAPIRVVEFSDFLCPYCQQIAGAFKTYIPQSANRVVLYYKNYPLEQTCNPNVSRTLHAGACNLALGAICAQDQGKFWAYHDRVFDGPPKNPGIAEVAAVAAGAGLDGPALLACMSSASARDRLAAEIQEAKQGQINGTPTVFINGRRLPRIEDFVQTVDREAVKIGLPPIGPPAAAGKPPAAPPPAH
jgi:serine/threonine-protein kinase